jgi:hypothetical protein
LISSTKSKAIAISEAYFKSSVSVGNSILTLSYLSKSYLVRWMSSNEIAFGQFETTKFKNSGSLSKLLNFLTKF